MGSATVRKLPSATRLVTKHKFDKTDFFVDVNLATQTVQARAGLQIALLSSEAGEEPEASPMGLAGLTTAGQAPSQPAGTSFSPSSSGTLCYSSCLQEENPRAILTEEVGAQSGWSTREEGGEDCTHMRSHRFARNISCCKPRVRDSTTPPPLVSLLSQ